MRAETRKPLALSRMWISRTLVFVILTAGALSWDLFSKSQVFRDLGYPGADPQPAAQGAHVIFSHPQGHEGESVPYLDGWMKFRLLTSFNRGALWGVGQEYTWLFAVLSLAAVIGIPTWLFAFRAARSLWLTAALSLILGGTLGNLYDRMGLHGCIDSSGGKMMAVRDFLLFRFGNFHWPVFNFADVFLVTGASMLILHSLLPARPTTPVEEPGANASHGSSSPEQTESNSPQPQAG
jgi:signal peptidase II